MGRGVLALPLCILADALQIPEGYALVAVQYDMPTQRVQFLVESNQLDEVSEGLPIPFIHLLVNVDHKPNGDRVTTTRIEKGY